MFRPTHAVATLVAVPALLALSTPRETIHFAPREGLALAKSFVTSTNMVLNELEVLLNGEPAPMPTDMDMSVNSVRTVEVVDTYMAVADGRPTKLKRSFEALGDQSDMAMAMMVLGEREITIEGESELTGQTVVFSWQTDEEAYDVTFDGESEVDPELLEGLTEDMDLRGLLPSDDVAVGDTWSIDPTAMIDVLAPGGELAILPDEDALGEMGEMGGGNSGFTLSELLGDLDGEVTGELTAIRDGGLAAITIKFEIESSNDITESVREARAGMETPAGIDSIEVESVDVEMTLEGEGVLLWSIKGGHFVEFTVTAQMDSTMDEASSISAPGQRLSTETAMTFSSTLELAYTAESL